MPPRNSYHPAERRRESPETRNQRRARGKLGYAGDFGTEPGQLPAGRRLRGRGLRSRRSGLRAHGDPRVGDGEREQRGRKEKGTPDHRRLRREALLVPVPATYLAPRFLSLFAAPQRWLRPMRMRPLGVRGSQCL